MVVISEGIHDANGVFIAEYGSSTEADAFGHKQMGGAAQYLANLVKERLGHKTRAIEFSLLQRCAAHCASKTDIDEAVIIGREAVRAAVSGQTDKMVGIVRAESDTYAASVKLFDLTSVANTERKFPLAWITEGGTAISNEFLDYILPLIQGESALPWENGMPRFARLKKIFVK